MPNANAVGGRKPLLPSPSSIHANEEGNKEKKEEKEEEEHRLSGGRVQPSRQAKLTKKYRDRKKYRSRHAHRPHEKTLLEASHEEDAVSNADGDGDADAHADADSDTDSDASSSSSDAESTAASSVVSLDEAAEIDIPSAEEDEEDGPDAASLRHQVPVTHCSNNPGSKRCGRPRKRNNFTMA